MGQHARAVVNQRLAHLAKRLAMGGIVVSKLFGHGQGPLLPLGHGHAGYVCQHPAHGVDRVNGGGPGLGQCSVNLGQVLLETLQPSTTKRPGALCQAVGGGGTDRARTAHDHVGDGTRRFDIVDGGDDFELMGKQALLDQLHPVSGLVKPHRTVMFRLPVMGDIHRESPGFRWCVFSSTDGGSTGSGDRFAPCSGPGRCPSTWSLRSRGAPPC